MICLVKSKILLHLFSEKYQHANAQTLCMSSLADLEYKQMGGKPFNYYTKSIIIIYLSHRALPWYYAIRPSISFQKTFQFLAHFFSLNQCISFIFTIILLISFFLSFFILSLTSLPQPPDLVPPEKLLGVSRLAVSAPH